MDKNKDSPGLTYLYVLPGGRPAVSGGMDTTVGRSERLVCVCVCVCVYDRGMERLADHEHKHNAQCKTHISLFSHVLVNDGDSVQQFRLWVCLNFLCTLIKESHSSALGVIKAPLFNEAIKDLSVKEIFEERPLTCRTVLQKLMLIK